MLNKPIRISKSALLSLVLVFWLSGLSLFAQNKQTAPNEPKKKQALAAQPKVSLSNQGNDVQKQNDATLKRAAAEQKRKEDQAIIAKKQSLTKENGAEVKNSKVAQNTSAKASKNTVETSQVKNDVNAETVKKDWVIKKAKLIQSLKDKNFSQQEIDKAVSKIERDMNNSLNKTK